MRNPFFSVTEFNTEAQRLDIFWISDRFPHAVCGTEHYTVRTERNGLCVKPRLQNYSRTAENLRRTQSLPGSIMARLFVFILPLLLLFSVILYSEDVYTTSLSLRLTNTNRVEVVFRASTNTGVFDIYRALLPISGEDVRKGAALAGSLSNSLPAVSNQSLYFFEGFTDTVPADGGYYYLVLPRKAAYTSDDYAPTLNYSISPVTVVIPAPVVIPTNTNTAVPMVTNTPVPAVRPQLMALSAEMTETNRVRLTFKANQPAVTVDIYRGQEVLKDNAARARAQWIASVSNSGAPVNGIYPYAGLIDTLTAPGGYYYLVLPRIADTGSNDYRPFNTYTTAPVNYIPPAVPAATNAPVVSRPAVTNTPPVIPLTNVTTITVQKPIVISDLKALSAGGTDVVLEWLADESAGRFRVYRGLGFPVGTPGMLSNAALAGVISARGTPEGPLFRYRVFKERLMSEGYYYYAVFEDRTNVMDMPLEAFDAGNNFTMNPLVLESSVILSPVSLRLDSITVKTNGGTVRLFWSVKGQDNSPYRFTVYRTTNFIRQPEDLIEMRPYRELTDEFFLEDADIQYGQSLYYTVILNGILSLEAGKNQTVEPVVFGGKEVRIPFVREETLTNISGAEFRARFRK